MKKFPKISITFAVAIFIVVCGVLVIQKNILENSYSEKIKINETSRVYNSKENIILTGTCNPESEIIVSWNGQFGLIESDKSGKWAVNLGTMPEGKYSLQMVSDGLENSRSVAALQITVDDSVKNLAGAVSFLGGMFRFLPAAISFNLVSVPDKLITISQATPPILQGEWKLLK